MVVDTKKELLNVNKLIYENIKTIDVESEMIVPDSKPDILSVVNTSGNVCVFKKEISNEKLKIEGNINSYIMYLADSSEDNIRGINVDLNFADILDAPNCNEKMILETNVMLKNINCNVINGRKISVNAKVEIKFKVYSNENEEVVNEIQNNNDIQILQNELTVNSIVGYGSTKAYVKDAMKIEKADNLAEILKLNINMVDKDIKVSYNKVLAKTEAEIKIVYLTEDNRIVVITNKIPVVGFIDIQNVSEENTCETNYEIKNMVIKPNNVEEHSIYVELEIEVSCIAYETKTLHLLQDLYNPVANLNCSKNDVSLIASKENRREVCNVKETVNIQGLSERKILDVDCIPIITKVNKLNSRIMYECDFELNFMIINSESSISTKQVNVPFEFNIDNIQSGENMNVNTELEVGTRDFIVKTGEEVSIDIDVIFNVNMYKNVNIQVVNNIEMQENKEEKNYSLVIYIVKQDDTMWSIAKKQRSTIYDILKANGIEDEKAVHPGDKLFIPKYISRCNQVAKPVM